MNCLQLNRIPLNNEYLHLPRELLDCCAAVANRSNMSKDLVSAMQRMYYLDKFRRLNLKNDSFFLYYIELNSQHHDVTEQINDFDQLLQTSEGNKDLQLNLKTIREMMLQATESNTELHRQMTIIIEHLKILYSPLEQLEKTLPKIIELDGIQNFVFVMIK